MEVPCTVIPSAADPATQFSTNPVDIHGLNHGVDACCGGWLRKDSSFLAAGGHSLGPGLLLSEPLVAAGVLPGEDPALLAAVPVEEHLGGLTVLQAGAALRAPRLPVAEHGAHAGVAPGGDLLVPHTLDHLHAALILRVDFTQLVFLVDAGAAVPARRARQLVALVGQVLLDTLLAGLGSTPHAALVAVLLLHLEGELETRLSTGSIG